MICSVISYLICNHQPTGVVKHCSCPVRIGCIGCLMCRIHIEQVLRRGSHRSCKPKMKFSEWCWWCCSKTICQTKTIDFLNVLLLKFPGARCTDPNHHDSVGISKTWGCSATNPSIIYLGKSLGKTTRNHAQFHHVYRCSINHNKH